MPNKKKSLPPPPKRLTQAECFARLTSKYPPKHEGEHRPKAKVRNEPTLVLDRLPDQGTTDWRKQDGIKIGAPTPGIWAEPNHRGRSIAATAKAKQKKRLRK